MIEIDNNAAKRSRREVVLGRKDFLFAGADTGSLQAAATCKLIETATLNDIDPESYLRHVPTHIAKHPKPDRRASTPERDASLAPS